MNAFTADRVLRINKLLKVIEAYNLAADKFIAKVDTGQPRSVVTYAELKAARELARTAGL